VPAAVLIAPESRTTNQEHDDYNDYGEEEQWEDRRSARGDAATFIVRRLDFRVIPPTPLPYRFDAEPSSGENMVSESRLHAETNACEHVCTDREPTTPVVLRLNPLLETLSASE
jgi:hypothetical protein